MRGGGWLLALAVLCCAGAAQAEVDEGMEADPDAGTEADPDAGTEAAVAGEATPPAAGPGLTPAPGVEVVVDGRPVCLVPGSAVTVVNRMGFVLQGTLVTVVDDALQIRSQGGALKRIRLHLIREVGTARPCVGALGAVPAPEVEPEPEPWPEDQPVVALPEPDPPAAGPELLDLDPVVVRTLERKRASGKKLRTIGIVFGTGAAPALGITSLALFLSLADCAPEEPCDHPFCGVIALAEFTSCGYERMLASAILGIAGMALGITGAVLWMTGQRNMNRAHRGLERLKREATLGLRLEGLGPLPDREGRPRGLALRLSF